MTKTPTLQENFRYRSKIGTLVLAFAVVSLAFGLSTGKDLVGNPWHWFLTAIHLFVLGLVAWRLFEIPRRLKLSEELVRFSEPVLMRIVLERVSAGEGADDYAYYVFVRGGDSPAAFYSNWRGLILEPYPSDIDALIERDLKAQVYFSKDHKPRLLKVEDLMLEIDSAKEAGNRWDGR